MIGFIIIGVIIVSFVLNERSCARTARKTIPGKHYAHRDRYKYCTEINDAAPEPHGDGQQSDGGLY